MKLLIKFPTRNRPEKFKDTLNLYIENLEDKSTKILVNCDKDDHTMNNKKMIDFLSKFTNVEITFNNNKSKIEAINSNLENQEFDILLLASDDMIPIIKGFDKIIINKMKTHYPDTDGVLWFNDGFQGDKLNTLCILGKKYYSRFNYIYYPSYRSVWCDNEFMDVANLLNKQTYIDETIIKHEHPDWGYGENDLVHKLNLKNENHDKSLYLKRKKNNFDFDKKSNIFSLNTIKKILKLFTANK